MKRYQISLTSDTEDILLRVFSELGLSGRTKHTEKLTAAIEHLANTWDAGQPDLAPPLPQNSSVAELLERLANPDIGLDLEVRNDTSPRDASDGMVPWDYILQRHPNLPYLEDERSEPEQLAIRFILTRTPESEWGSAHVASVVERALLEVKQR